MADRLFDRDVTVNIGGLRIASRLLSKTRKDLGLAEGERSNLLKVVFDITKTVKKEPNQCTLQIYNLRSENRIALQQRKVETIVEAGYIDNTSILFRGTLEYSTSVLDGQDWITTLQSSDGTDKIKSSRINTSLKGPVKAGDVLRVAARALGLKPGNLSKAIRDGSVRGSLSEFTNGIVLSGKADKVLDSVAKSMGYFYSIQDGQLILLTQDSFLGSAADAVLLTPQTGLIGSPEPGEDGFVNARSLIQRNLLPGYRVRIESAEVNGFFRIERVDFSGDTWGDDWYADIECRPLGGTS